MKYVLESWILNSTFCSHFNRVFFKDIGCCMIKSALLMLIFIYRFLWGFFSQRFSEWIYLYYCYLSVRKNFLYSKFFWSAFSRIWTEYGDLQNLCIQSKCRRIQTRKTTNTDTFHVVYQIRFLPRFIEWIYCSCAYSLMPYPRNLEDFEQTSWSHFLLLWT